MVDSRRPVMMRSMFRTIMEAAISAFIVLGSIATAWLLYSKVSAVLHDPSLPHGVVWHALFGR
jgi:hypothetical protein